MSDDEEKIEVVAKKNLKHKRDVDQSLLDLYYNLAENKQEVRIAASVAFIRILKQKQAPLGENEKSRELSYSIDRLVRGMSSPRQYARQAFSVVLSEVLRQFVQVDIEEVLKLMEEHLPVTKKQEKCQAVIGRLMTFSAIIQSGRLVDSPLLSLVILKLYDLARNKGYIQEAVYKLFLNLFSNITEEQFKQSLWSHLKEELQFGWEKSTPDNMWLLLLIVRTFPNTVKLIFLRRHFGDENLLSADSQEHWKRIIKQSCSVHPHFHPVCTEFINFGLERKLLKSVWKPVVDDNLFESDQSEKCFLGFRLVKEVLGKTQKKKQVKVCLSPNFCTAISRSYLNLRHPLHSAALDLVTFFCNYVKNTTDFQIQMEIIKFMIQMSNQTSLDRILTKKEYSQMVSHLSADGVKQLCELMKSVAFQNVASIETTHGGDKLEVSRSQAIQEMGILISHIAVSSEVEWRIEMLKFLCLHSYFVVSEPTEAVSGCEMTTTTMSKSLRIAFQKSFNRALDSFNRRSESSASPLQQLIDVLKLLVTYIDQLLSMENVLKPAFNWTKVQETWARVKKISHKLKKLVKKGKKKDRTDIFQILVLQLGLQLFQEPVKITSTLEELDTCCKRANIFDKVDNDSDQEDDLSDTPPWIDVLVDILLSLLSQPSHHMRCVVNSVFPLVCPLMTVESLQLILDVINPSSENTESALVNESDDEEIDFESGSSNANSDDDEEMEDDIKGSEKFKMQLQKVLSTANDEDDDESDDNLTDTEMFKLDDALSEVFRSRKSKKTLNDEEKALIDFRNRCLELIVTYVKSEPPLEAVLRCIKPVMSALEFGKEKHKYSFTGKAVVVLKAVAKSGNVVISDKMDHNQLVDAMDYLLQRSYKDMTVDARNIVYSLCAFVTLNERKLLAKVQNVDVQKVNVKNLQCLNKYFDALRILIKHSSSHVKPDMFVTLMNSCPEYAWSFLEPLEMYAFDEGVRLFNKSMCLGLMLSAMRFSKGQKSIAKNKWIKFSDSIIPKLLESLKLMLQGSDIKPMYMTELFDILVSLNHIMKEKYSMNVISHDLDLANLLCSKNCRNLNKNGKGLRRKVITLFGGDPTAPITGSTKATPNDDVHEKSDKIEVDANEESDKIEDDSSEEGDNIEEKVNGDNVSSSDDFNEDSDS